MQPAADRAERDQARLAVVAAPVGIDRCRGPVEPRDLAEIEAMLAAVLPALRFVPVPNLYAYINFPFKSQDEWGLVDGCFRDVSRHVAHCGGPCGPGSGRGSGAAGQKRPDLSPSGKVWPGPGL
jgi:hypothetical protein